MKPQFVEMLSEAKKRNPNAEMIKILQSADFGYTEKGGNGRVKKDAGGVMIYDSFYYGEAEALKKLIASWKPNGHNYDYFKNEEGLVGTIKKSGSNTHSKIFKSGRSGSDGGDVWILVDFKEV